MKLSETLLPEFDQEMSTTRRVLERCPSRSWTMAQLATHLANMPGWTVDTLRKESLDIAPVDGPAYRNDVVGSPDELLEVFDRKVAEARVALAETSDADYMKNWTMLVGGKVIFTLPRAAVLRTFIFNHNVHHRGQLSVYLRLNDIPVPAIYGPSADESGM
jgi:uncharacterized damage-inducible protein DinB